MMTADFEKEIASYEPGFINIHFETSEDVFNLNDLYADNKELFSSFFHEYIHFIQEISTSYGLMKGFHYLELLKDMISRVRSSESPVFEVPFRVDNRFNVQVNLELEKLYRGQGGGKKESVSYVKYEQYLVETVSIEDRDGVTRQTRQYRVYFYNGDKKKYDSFLFGSTCIKEYMTHALQEWFFPGRQHPDIPYKILELIVEKEYPDLCRNLQWLIALCDACLMVWHPAELFFNTLKRMKKERFIPETPSQIYGFAFFDLQLVQDGKALSVEEVYDSTVTLAINQYTDALKSEIFSANRKWLEYLIRMAQGMRNELISFPVHFVKGKEKLAPDFFMAVKMFGTPFLKNDTHKGGFVPPEQIADLDIQPYQLMVFREIIHVFYGATKCGLYAFCKTRPDKDITNHHCQTAPWLRANPSEDLCPFAQFWKTWGLMGKTPIPRKS